MSSSIKVSSEVYQKLRALARVRETFSDTIGRLIELWEVLEKASPLIGGAESYLRWQQEQANAKKTVDGWGDSPKVPHL